MLPTAGMPGCWGMAMPFCCITIFGRCADMPAGKLYPGGRICRQRISVVTQSTVLLARLAYSLLHASAGVPQMNHVSRLQAVMLLVVRMGEVRRLLQQGHSKATARADCSAVLCPTSAFHAHLQYRGALHAQLPGLANVRPCVTYSRSLRLPHGLHALLLALLHLHLLLPLLHLLRVLQSTALACIQDSRVKQRGEAQRNKL